MPFTTALTLTVSDVAGVAQAAVGGGTNGRTVRLYRAPFTGRTAMRAWTLAGSGTITGTTATITDAAAGSGYYDWLAVQLTGGGDVDAMSGAVYRPLGTDDENSQSVWEQCVTHTVTTITALQLSGLTSDKIIDGWLPTKFQGISPAPPSCWVAPFGAETYPGRLNDKDDVGYPVVVLLIDAADRESRRNFRRNLIWRERISRALRYDAPAGISEVFWTDINPDTIVNPDAWRDGLWASALLFRFISREERGLILP